MPELNTQYPIITHEQLKFAYDVTMAKVLFKQHPDDFIVTENLSFTPSGEGTHAYVLMQKKLINTLWLAEQLAKFSGIPVKHIGYAGLKDRQATTTQWFSINLEGISEPDWSKLEIPNAKLISQTYHPRKLKIGSIQSNSFSICLKDVSPDTIKDIEKKLELIKLKGFPNYFGPQRFGHNYNNIHKARDWFLGKYKVKQRSKKSFYLSSVRSMLFNQLLSQRIKKFGWNKLISGELMLLDGTHSFFLANEIDDTILQRFHSGDIHPSLSLWGSDDLQSSNELYQLEIQLKNKFLAWTSGLENKGLKQDRRAYRVLPKDLNWETFPINNQLKLQFSLPSGSYATSLLREVCEY